MQKGIQSFVVVVDVHTMTFCMALKLVHYNDNSRAVHMGYEL